MAPRRTCCGILASWPCPVCSCWVADTRQYCCSSGCANLLTVQPQPQPHCSHTEAVNTCSIQNRDSPHIVQFYTEACTLQSVPDTHLLACGTEPGSGLRQEICLCCLLILWTKFACPASTLQHGVGVYLLHPDRGMLLPHFRVELAAPTCLLPCDRGPRRCCAF